MVVRRERRGRAPRGHACFLPSHPSHKPQRSSPTPGTHPATACPPLLSVLMTVLAGSLKRMAVTGAACRLGSWSSGSLAPLQGAGGGKIR